MKVVFMFEKGNTLKKLLEAITDLRAFPQVEKIGDF